jgi:hypothetical protein
MQAESEWPGATVDFEGEVGIALGALKMVAPDMLGRLLDNRGRRSARALRLWLFQKTGWACLEFF